MASRITKTRRGSGHSYALDGKRVPGVTTVLRNAMPQPWMKTWAARTTAQWAATNRELVTSLGETEWIKQAASAPDVQRDAAALRGNVIHGHAHTLLTTGQVDGVEAQHLPVVEQAARFLERWGVEEIAAERPCANTVHMFAGTFDLLARLSDGHVWLLDYKTGKGPFPEHVLQVAGYALCDIYQADEETDLPMPPVERIGAVMLREDGWDLVPFDHVHLSDLQTYFLHARRLADFTEWTSGYPRPAWEVVGAPLPKPEAVAS